MSSYDFKHQHFLSEKEANSGISAASNPPAPVSADSLAVPAYVPSDPLFGQQWHLNPAVSSAHLNVTSVWDEYRGSGVLVGVIDDGIAYNHADLDGNYNHTVDFDHRDNDPDPAHVFAGDRHGTAVAGVIAAEADNGYGGSGVAPEAQIASYRIGFTSAFDINQVTAAFQSQEANVDISNNSWGFDGFFGDNLEDPTPYLWPTGAVGSFQAAGQALESAVTNGRGGLGTVFVISAGNDRSDGQDVNYHGFQNSPDTIAVAATTSGGGVASFSTPGAAILVAAPGVGVVTTDRPGGDGYVSTDFVSINGTSFSSPATAGVIALMLEANPNLGYRDVQEILAYSARNPLASTAGWQTNGADTWNGGGLTVSHDYGYGLVDAHAAVRLAETWQSVSTKTNLADESAASAPGAFIADNATVVDTVSFAGTGILIDQITLALNVTHTQIGDLTVTLTSPSGTQSVLVNRPGVTGSNAIGATQDNINFTLSSVQYWGESGDGTWSLSVTDSRAGNTGFLNSWTLTLLGDADNGGDVYIYTEEFDRHAGEPGRQTLSDSGGHDTVNAAAVTTGSKIDLNGGGTSVIDGVAVTTALGSVIENAIGGDGADTLIGNDADNWLSGMRADDTITGGAGNDTLEGGVGNDRLEGGDGDDTVLGNFGNDWLIGGSGAGDDSYDGGEGIDTLDFSSTALGVVADLSSGQALGHATESGTDSLVRIENLIGGSGDDTLIGDGGNNTLDGGSGADSLEGGAGNDFIEGGQGDDTIDGGGGDDTLVYRGLFDDFGFSFNSPDEVVITAAAGIGLGSDTASNVEFFQFDDILKTLSELYDEFGSSGGSTADIELTLGTAENGQYGHFFDPQRNDGDEVTASFQGTGQDLVLTLTGYDIDKSNEVAVLLNGNSLGFLSQGPNNGLNAGNSFAIAAAQQQQGENILTFAQQYSGWGWGVTNILLQETGAPPPPPATDIALTLGTLESGQYGHFFDPQRNDGDEVTASFQGTGQDLVLTLTGYDIDRSNEVEVLLNGNSLGFLSQGPNNGLNAGNSFAIAAAQQQGENILTFAQQYSGWAWGVTDILLQDAGAPPPPAPTDITLTVGTLESGQYGHFFDPQRNDGDEVTASFQGTGQDLLLSLTGYDIDKTTEVQVLLNGNSLGFLSQGPNNGLNAGDSFAITAAQQQQGENILTFAQQFTGWGWGVTNILLQDAAAPTPSLVAAGDAAQENSLLGGAGDDILNGGEGDDVLAGGLGFDTLTGGGGQDTDSFQFAQSDVGSGVDRITDFAPSSDKIDLADLFAPGLVNAGNLAEYVAVVESGNDSLLRVDLDGGGDGFVDLAIITDGVSNGVTDADALLSSGQLIIA